MGLFSGPKKALLEGMPSLIQSLTKRERGIIRQNITQAIGGSEANAVKAIDVAESSKVVPGILALSHKVVPVCVMQLGCSAHLSKLPEKSRM